ncbi:MAG: hypothetical protein V4673_09025 [Pseudomonadota bacterium]
MRMHFPKLMARHAILPQTGPLGGHWINRACCFWLRFYAFRAARQCNRPFDDKGGTPRRASAGRPVDLVASKAMSAYDPKPTLKMTPAENASWTSAARVIFPASIWRGWG